MRSCGIQASYIDFAPGIMVFSVCNNYTRYRVTKLHTCGTENVIPVATLIFIVLKGCGLTEIHVIGSKGWFTSFCLHCIVTAEVHMK